MSSDLYYSSKDIAAGATVKLPSTKTASAILLLQHSDNPELNLIVGKINERDRNRGTRQHRDEDKINLHFVISDRARADHQGKFDSKFRIELACQFKTTDLVQHKEVISANFDYRSIIRAVKVENYPNLGDERKSAIIDLFKTDTKDPQWARIIGKRGALQVVSFQTRPSRSGINLFTTKEDYGTQTEYIQRFKSMVASGAHFILLVRAEHLEVAVNQCYANLNMIQQCDSNNPIRLWFTPQPNKPAHQLNTQWGRLLLPQDRPNIELEPQITFPDMATYIAIFATGVQQEYEFDRDNARRTYTCNATVVTAPHCGDARFLVFLHWEENENQYRPRPNDRFTISFNNTPEEDRTQPWSPEDADGNYDQAQDIPLHLDFKDIPADRATAASFFAKAPSVAISFSPSFNDRVYRRIFAAIPKLQPRSQHEGFLAQIRQILCAEDFEGLNPVNLFTVENFGPNVQQIETHIRAKFNVGQNKVVDNLVDGRGPVTMIIGPPGTGKTEVAIAIVASLAQTRQVLVCTPTSQTALVFTHRLVQSVTETLCDQYNESNPFLVARVYSTASERDLARPSFRPTIMQRDQREDIDAIRLAQNSAKMHIVQRYDDIYHRNIPGINILEKSLGYLMGAFAGIITNPATNLPFLWARPNNHHDFVARYNDYINGKDFSGNQAHEFKKSINGLRRALLANINVVVTTLSNASQHKMSRNLTPSLVVIDEAAKAKEPDLWGALTQYPSTQKILLLGDPMQLRPLVVSQKRNNMSPQLRLSLVSRLSVAGAPSIDLTEEHRFCPDIASIISILQYRGTITNAPTVMDSEHGRSMRAIHGALFAMPFNAIVTNFENSHAGKSSANPSSWNVKEAVVVITTLQRYLVNGVEPKDIAVLTPYESQFAIIGKGVKELALQMDRDLSQILISKFDQMTGDQRPLVFVSLTVTESLGFMSDNHRFNAAISRAETGLNIIANVTAIRNIAKIDKKMIGTEDDPYVHAIQNNKRWADSIKSRTPSLLPTLSKGQSPKILWLGCSDSRVPETTILDLSPGDVFVHRNIANIINPTDLSALSVIEYAVAKIKVQHIVLCGHTSCGGVTGALGNKKLGKIDTWLTPLRRLRKEHTKELESLATDAEKNQRLVELNVQAGMEVLRENPDVIDAVEDRGLQLHGLVYDIASGELHDLNLKDEDEGVRKMAFVCH